jgi:hypothetical protein
MAALSFAHNHCVNRRKTVSAQASRNRLSLPISKLPPILLGFVYSIEVHPEVADHAV